MFRKRGFTLVELIVVIGIISLLTAVVTASLSGARAKSRDARRMADIGQLELALEVWRQVNGRYPEESSGGDDANGIVGEGAGLDTILDSVSTLKEIPHDPLGPGHSEYQYYYDGDHDCGGTPKAVIFARTMENTVNANWGDVCGGSDTEGGASADSYMVVLGESAG